MYIPHYPGPGPSGGNLSPWMFWGGEGDNVGHIEDWMVIEASDLMRKEMGIARSPEVQVLLGARADRIQAVAR